MTSPVVAFGVLVIAIVLEAFSLRTAISESQPGRGSASWRSFVRFIRRAKAPELPAVLLEDIAALIGLVFALAGVSLTEVDRGRPVGRGRVDRHRGAAGCVAVILAVEMKSLLIGESASPDVEPRSSRPSRTARRCSGSSTCGPCTSGPETLLVAAKIAVAAQRRRRPESWRASTPPSAGSGPPCRSPSMIYLEPDLYRAARADLADPAVRAARRPPSLLVRGRRALRARRQLPVPGPAASAGASDRPNHAAHNGVITGVIGPFHSVRLGQRGLSQQGEI